jgi:hypothetical protein
MHIQILATIPKKDYSQNWNDFLYWFATEESYLAYLEIERWGAMRKWVEATIKVVSWAGNRALSAHSGQHHRTHIAKTDSAHLKQDTNLPAM